MNGKLLTKNTSKVSLNRFVLFNIAEVLLMLGFGVLAITLHAYLRYPLNLPGHHGIEFMALLIFGLKISRYKLSPLLFSAGLNILLLLPVLGFKDPFAPIVYSMPGVIICGFALLAPSLLKKFWFLAFAGGIAYAFIPITRLLIMLITGYSYNSMLLKGPPVVILSFFIFGVTGSLFTSGIFKTLKK